MQALRPHADAFLAHWQQSPDAQRCLAIIVALRPYLGEAQAAWLLAEIVLDGPPARSGTPAPAAPMKLTTLLGLLERSDPRPVRAPFHRLLVANLGTSPLLEEARAALPTLPLDVLLRLSFHLESTHPLRRELSEEAQRRCAAVAGSTDDATRPEWFAEHLLPTFDRGGELQGMRVAALASTDAESLARDYLERGRRILGDEFVAKADELRRLSRGASSVSGNLSRDAMRRELADKLAKVVEARIASSPLRRDVALVAASHIPVQAADAYGRARLFEQLATTLQLTHGEVARVMIELRDRDADARPELRKRLERVAELPAEPIFPLQPGDRFSATTFSNPLLPSETSHELGHAYEAACPEVLSAAAAMRGMIAIGPPRPLNDLAVIHSVACASGVDGMHEKLLRTLATRETWPILDSAKAVRTLLAGHGLESVIDGVLASQEWATLRPYAANEIALPVAAHPYLGKICPDGSTEIVSVGFEKLTSGEDLLNAYLDCPEHVLFTLGCLPS
ncbi:MAG: hypothetical protein ACAI38_12890 [Myxococcota bacterium]